MLALAQSYANIELHSDGKPIPYYSVNTGKDWLIADSLGITKIPQRLFNKKLNIHTLTKDTAILFGSKDLKLNFRSTIQLSEIEIYSNLSLSSIKKVNTSPSLFNSFGFASSKQYPIEHGKFYEFTTTVVLDNFRIKVENSKKTNQLVVLNIFSVDSQNKIVPVHPQRLNNLKGKIANGHIDFDISEIGTILIPKGKYFFVIDLLPNEVGLIVSFNKVKSSQTLMRMSRSKWYSYRTDGREIELVTELKYREVKKQ